jgi:hypothetical protein
MKTLLFMLLAAVSTPVFACSCRFDDRTLEQRVDAAERVLRVRIVGAELTGEITRPDATRYDKFLSERIAYRLRTVETLKGSDSVPPQLLGQAGDGGGDCTVRLPVGAEIILFVEASERQMSFNYCNQPYEGVEDVPEIDLRLLAIRDFVSERAPIHACENLRSITPERKGECDARRSAALDAWRSTDRRTEAE